MIRYASRYMGYDTIQGYILITEQFGAIWCDTMQPDTVLNICLM